MTPVTTVIVSAIALGVVVTIFKGYQYNKRQIKEIELAKLREKNQRKANIKACLDYDLTLVKNRYQKNTNSSNERIDLIEKEFKRFFILLSASPISLGLNSKEIDDFWHEIITCTAIYRDFCEKVANRFIDHDPLGGSLEAYQRTYLAYEKAFNEKPNPSIWPEIEINLGRDHFNTLKNMSLATGVLALSYTVYEEDKKKGEYSSSGADGSVVFMVAYSGSESSSSSSDSGSSDGGSSCGGGCGGC